MAVKFEIKRPSSPYVRYFLFAIVAIFLSYFQFMFENYISIAGITPDLILILVVFISLTEGRFTGVIAGFLIGLLFDYISFDVIGTNALTKTCVAFFAGSFYRQGEEISILGNSKFLAIIFGCSFIHNIIYFLFYLKLTDISFMKFFVRFGISFT